MISKYLKSLRYVLDNHQKLISMINSNILPIKEILLKDTYEMKSVIDRALQEEKKEFQNNGKQN